MNLCRVMYLKKENMVANVIDCIEQLQRDLILCGLKSLVVKSLRG